MALHVFDLEGFSLGPPNPGDWNVDGLNRMFFQANQQGGGLATLMRAGTYLVASASLVIKTGVLILVGPNVFMVDSITLVAIPTLQAVTVSLSAIAGNAFIGLTNVGLATLP